MRRLSLLLLAALLGLSASALHLTNAKSAYAITNACGWQDQFGQVQADGYWSSSVVITGSDFAPHTLNIDLAAWRIAFQGDPACRRAFYVSTWFSDHAYGYQHPVVNAYSNWPDGTLRGPWTFNHGTSWDWGNYTWTGPSSYVICETCAQWGPWEDYVTTVTLPNGASVPVGFGVNRNFPRIANSANSHVFDQNWPGRGPFFDVWSTTTSGWYVSIYG